jgi:phage/plasmid primase-like uncharacterized protein
MMTDHLTIIRALGGNEHSGMCFCPAHDNKNTPALHVSNRNGKVLLKCHAGCPQEAVIDTLREKRLWTKSKSSGSREEPRLDQDAKREQHALREKASKDANTRWRKAELASSQHPYCVRKGVKPDKLRTENWSNGANPLLVPMYDSKGKLRNLHFIHVDGKKHSITGGQHKDMHYWIARPEDADSNTILIGEGWATGKSAYDATDHAVCMSFGKANLLSVSKWVRRKYLDHKIILLADDDGGDGITEANEAARAVGGFVAVPKFGERRRRSDKDFNDLNRVAGHGEVKRQINDAVEPDPEVEEEREPGNASAERQVDTLTNLAADAELFHRDDDVYADIYRLGHRETWPIRSKGFKDWLSFAYYERFETAPNPQALRAALDVIAARAKFGGEQREVYIRVGGHDGKIYLDLCNDTWQGVEIDAVGWRVVDKPPVRFVRKKGMLPLPVPQKGGTVEDLRPFINVRTDQEEKRISDTDFVLVVAWLLAAYREQGPYPILKVWGEPGSSKSTTTEVLRALIDPHKVTRRRLPREDRDLFIAANNAWLLSYDNLSSVPEWLSNSLCTISTGGGYATRALYTDQDEQLFDAKRPVILNGVENFPAKHDLADRTILVELPFIPASERRREKDFWAKFEAKRPLILGALLDVVAHGLKTLSDVPEEDWPRMADFAHWITACESALWEQGTFRKAYETNREKATQSAIDDDLVATALRAFINQHQSPWHGTTAELLEALTAFVGDSQSKSKDWPQNARALTGHLQKAKGSLRRIGITIKQGGRTSKGRILTITPNPNEVRAPSRPGNDRHDNHDRHFHSKPAGIGSDGRREGRSGRTSQWSLGRDDRKDTHRTDTRPSEASLMNYRKK